MKLDARGGIKPLDYDVAIISPKKMAKAKEMGLDITNGPLTSQQIDALGLTEAQRYLTTASKGSKQVNFNGSSG